MPADFSALFDSLLVIAGLALVVTGIVMFIRSKSSTDASSVEAFGIKLNVTHPSLILVLAGVGLMLAPRLLPEQPDKGSTPEPSVVAEAAKPESTAPPIVEQAPGTTPSPPAVAPPSPPAAPQVRFTPSSVSVPPSVKPRVIASATPPAPAARAAPPIQPERVTPSAPGTVPPQAAVARPEPVAATAPEAPVIRPSSPAKAARPTLVYAALGLPISRGFWNGETRTSYTGRLHASLQQAGQEILRMDASELSLSQTTFDAWWNETDQYPRSRERCTAANAPRALLTARVETPQVMSSIESAYWPELKLRLYHCATQKQYRQQKTLSPKNTDAWPFATELNGEIERFLRTYRGDLAE